jgi:spore germination protein YaaH
MSTKRSTSLLSSIVLVVLSSCIAAPVLAAEGPFVHEQMLRSHEGLEPITASDVGFPTAAQLANRGRSDGPIVMGYLPYWVSAQNLPWQHLDVLAWFSAEVNADGSLGDTHGWGGSGSDAVIEAAHAVGAIVVLSATRFGTEALNELLIDSIARTNTINNLISAMINGGGDGLDIDFEGLGPDNRDQFVDFIIELRAAMDEAQPGSHLSLATPAVDWDGSYDYDVLANYSDLLFIMGYAFAGSWSDPKPNAPLYASDQWGSRSLQWSAQDYIEWGGIENAPGIVMGLPLYGNTWSAESGEIGALKIEHLGSTFYAPCQEVFAEHGRYWDSDSSSPWISWQQGGQWHQTWCEDEVSISMKAQMALDEGLGGFGFWALEYDENDSLLWDAITSILAENGDDDDSSTGDDDDSSTGDDDDSSTGDDDDSFMGDDDDDTGAAGPRTGCSSCQGCETTGASSSHRPDVRILLLAMVFCAGWRRQRRQEPHRQ